jgi:hypothetical protein
MPRERDIRIAARDALVATREYDNVWLHWLKEAAGEMAADVRGIGIEPEKTLALTSFDAAPGGGWIYETQIGLEVLVRMTDIELRDAEAERLLNVARNTLNGNDLGGLAMAQFTIVASWAWVAAVPPQRTIHAILKARYIEENWQGQDTTP